jgi:hypothetical protein
MLPAAKGMKYAASLHRGKFFNSYDSVHFCGQPTLPFPLTSSCMFPANRHPL